jgi:hypothetical protein
VLEAGDDDKTVRDVGPDRLVVCELGRPEIAGELRFDGIRQRKQVEVAPARVAITAALFSASSFRS